jgi:hypothetical protein
MLLCAGLCLADERLEPMAPDEPYAPASFVVADATDVMNIDDGAVYRITASGEALAIGNAGLLQSPSGVMLFDTTESGQQFLVSDIGTFFTHDDGALFLIEDGMDPVVVYAGAPLTSPFGMLLDGNLLYLSDFGDPDPTLQDGTVYEFDLDSDGDNKPGPYPLDETAIRVIWTGAPLNGPNEMVWLQQGRSLMMADDSGFLYEMDVREGEDATPMPFGPEFGDPVGLARSKDGFLVVDAENQEIWHLDDNGVDLMLLLAGDPALDQFLGVDAGKTDAALVSNAGSLYDGEDGSIMLLDGAYATIPYSGPPLQNPFGLLIEP